MAPVTSEKTPHGTRRSRGELRKPREDSAGCSVPVPCGSCRFADFVFESDHGVSLFNRDEEFQTTPHALTLTILVVVNEFAKIFEISTLSSRVAVDQVRPVTLEE